VTSNRIGGGVCALGVCAFAWQTHAAAPEFVFQEVGGASGILAYQMAPGLGGGGACADFDDDGDIDLFVPNDRGVADQLYENQGDGTFVEIAAARGVASIEQSRAALWVDYDADGRLDLLVARDDHLAEQVTLATTLVLWRQRADGTFEDVTQAAGLFGNLSPRTDTHIGGLAAGDLNADSLPDLVVARWDDGASLFLSDGQGGFIDASVSSGLAALPGDYWQPLIFDCDADGAPDIMMNVDFSPNRLLRNNTDGTFTDVAAAAGCDSDFNEMGLGLGDYDNDGDFDAYCTNLYRLVNGTQQHNVFFRNDSTPGAPSFAEISMAIGVDNGGFGWGATFFDADLDGWLDLAESNSTEQPSEPTETMRFFLSAGGASPTFSDVSAQVGFDQTEWGSALMAADLDRDGDPDLVQTIRNGPLRIFRNDRSGDAAGRNWLVVRPRTTGGNTHAIGAVVRASAGGMTMSRLITAGVSFQSQEPAEAHFGLGEAGSVDLLAIEWPDGSTRTIADVGADRILTPVQGCVADFDLDGKVGASDLSTLLSGWGATGPANFDSDAGVDADDLSVLLASWGPCR